MTRRDFILKASVPFLVAACSKEEDEERLPKRILESGLKTSGEIYVCSGALIQCNQGSAPSELIVTEEGRPTWSNGKPLANIMDFAPETNIPAFGMCRSTNNPLVAAATAAAFGVLTPMSCVPSITQSWSSASQQKIANFPALVSSSKTTCMWGGQITITFPGYPKPTEG